jgi:hypothetical protein
MNTRASVVGRVSVVALCAALGAGPTARADATPTQFAQMAPLDQYLIGDRSAEIALARSAAPESISKDATVLVLGKHGYESAEKGTNGFVCLVERSWTAPKDDPDFWNPKLRAPICFNPAAVRTVVPITLKKTDLILAGRSGAEMAAAIGAALDKKELPPLEREAMCYMLSKQQYVSERDPHWHPHLMFFVPLTTAGAWGASVPRSPIIATEDKDDRMTVFLVPVGRWSDGTAAEIYPH